VKGTISGCVKAYEVIWYLKKHFKQRNGKETNKNKARSGKVELKIKRTEDEIEEYLIRKFTIYEKR
jgi:hypothetical protein